MAGEPGGSIPSTRNAIEKLWDAKVYDFYGLSDIFGAQLEAGTSNDSSWVNIWNRTDGGLGSFVFTDAEIGELGSVSCVVVLTACVVEYGTVI